MEGRNAKTPPRRQHLIMIGKYVDKELNKVRTRAAMSCVHINVKNRILGRVAYGEGGRSSRLLLTAAEGRGVLAGSGITPL